MMSTGPLKVFSVRNYHRLQIEQAIVFHDDNKWTDADNCFPYPVLVAVDVDREDPHVLSKSGSYEKIIYVFTSDPGLLHLQIVLPVEIVALNVTDILFASIQYHSLPVVIQEQKSSVAFFIV